MINFEKKIFISAVILGIAFRIFALQNHDFWFDEAFTYHVAKLPIKDLMSAAITDNNPPLYYLLIHFVLKISQNEVILRIPSFIFNMLTLFLIYFGFQQYLAKRVCFIASILFALSPLALYLSSEARLHSLAVLFAVLMVLSFFKTIKSPTKKNIFIYIISAIFGVYTQYYLLLLFLPFTVIVLQKKVLSLRLWLLVTFTPLAALLPWLYFSSLITRNGCACPPTWLSLPSVLVSPAIGGVGNITMRVFRLLPQQIFFLFTFTVILTMIFFFLGIFRARLMALVFLIPLFVLSIAGFIQPIFSPKAFSVFSPFYFFLVAYGVTFFKRQNMLIVILLVSLSLVSLIQLTNPFFVDKKLQQTYGFANRLAIPVAHTSILTYYSFNYYSRGHAQQIFLADNPFSKTTAKYIGGQKSDIPDLKAFFLVDVKKQTGEAHQESLLLEISKKYRTAGTYSYNEIYLTLYEKR